MTFVKAGSLLEALNVKSQSLLLVLLYAGLFSTFSLFILSLSMELNLGFNSPVGKP